MDEMKFKWDKDKAVYELLMKLAKESREIRILRGRTGRTIHMIKNIYENG